MRYLLTSLVLLTLMMSSCRRDDHYYPPQPQFTQFIEEFDNDYYNWGFVDNYNDAEGYVQNGRYTMAYLGTASEAYYISKDIGFNRNDDFTIHTRIGSDNNMGLLFGYNSSVGAYGYTFTIDYDGYYALYDEGGNGFGNNIQALVEPQTGNFVNINGDWNELRLEQRGNYWYGFVNNVQVFVIDAQPLKGTNVGYMLIQNTVGDADYLQVDWYQ